MYTYARAHMHVHAYRHALMEMCVCGDRVRLREAGRRYTHPSHMLTSLLAQNCQTPDALGSTDEVKAAFAEHFAHVDITDDNKDALLLACARAGLASRVRAVLEAGADAAHTDQVRVGT